MENNSELTSVEIPDSTLAAAQILECDPQVLMGLYDDEFYEEIEDNQVLAKKIDDLFSTLFNFLDPENEEFKEKTFKAMDKEPLFKKFVFDFLIQSCAEEVVSCSSLLSKDTFKETFALIHQDEALKEKLDDAIDGEEIMRAAQILMVHENIRAIKISIYAVLQNHLDEDLFSPDSNSRKIHELAFKAIKSFGVDLNEQEEREYKQHLAEGPCSICDILERKREFENFQQFLDFIKDAR